MPPSLPDETLDHSRSRSLRRHSNSVFEAKKKACLSKLRSNWLTQISNFRSRHSAVDVQRSMQQLIENFSNSGRKDNLIKILHLNSSEFEKLELLCANCLLSCANDSFVMRPCCFDRQPAISRSIRPGLPQTVRCPSHRRPSERINLARCASNRFLSLWSAASEVLSDISRT